MGPYLFLFLGFAAFWIGQLVFPTIIFFLTIAKAVRLHVTGLIKDGIIRTMLRDGESFLLSLVVPSAIDLSEAYAYTQGLCISCEFSFC